MMRKAMVLVAGLLLAGGAAAKVEDKARWTAFGLEGEVQGENAVFTLSLTFEDMARDDALEVLRGAATVQASSLPKGLRLVRQGEAYTLERDPKAMWLWGKRKGEASLTFAAQTRQEGAWRVTRFSLPVLPVRDAKVRMADTSLEAVMGGTVVAEARVAEDGRKVLAAKLVPRPEFVLSWRPDVRLAQSDLVASCDVNTVATVSPGALRVDSVFTYQVAQGQLNELEIRSQELGDRRQEGNVEGEGAAAGPSLNVLSVSGPDIQDWRVEGDVLRVQLAHPQSGAYRLGVVCERPLGAFPCAAEVPVLVPQGMIRVGGDVLLGTDSAVRLQVASSSGLTQVEAGAFPKVAQEGDAARHIPAKSVFVWQYAALPFALSVTADNIATLLNAEMNMLVSVADAAMTLDATVQMDVRDAPTREVRIEIPADPRWVVVSVSGSPFAENDVDTVAAGEGREIVIPFRKPVSGNVTAMVRLEARLAALKGESGVSGAIAVPRLSVKGAKAQRGYLVAAAERGMRLVPQGAQELNDIHTASVPFKAEGAQLAYRFREANWSLGLAFEYAQSAIHSEVFHLVSLGQGVVYVSAAVNGHISGAPVQTLRFRVPAAIQGLDVTGVDIDSWSRKDDVCTVRLVNRILGDFTLLLSYDHPISYDDATLTIGEIETLDTASELGYMAVATSAPLGVIEAAALPPSLIRIPRDELPEGYAATVTAPVVGAWKYTRPDHAVALRIQALDNRQPIDQVVDFLQIESSIGNEGESVTTATWQVKNTSRQYLEIQLPPDATVWKVRQGAGAATRDIPAQQANDRLLVPVERPRNPNQAISIAVTYAQPAATPRRYGNVDLTAPRLPDTPVTFATWRVSVDEHRAFANATGGSMSRERQRRIVPLFFDNALFDAAGSSLTFYRTATLGSEPALSVSVRVVPALLGGANTPLLVTCGVICLLGLVLAVFPWRGRRIALATGIAAVFMAAFTLPATAPVASSVGAGLFVLAFLIWIVRGIARLFKRRPAPAQDDDDDPPPLIDMPPPAI